VEVRVVLECLLGVDNLIGGFAAYNERVADNIPLSPAKVLLSARGGAGTTGLNAY
jgi:hypothetical protein